MINIFSRTKQGISRNFLMSILWPYNTACEGKEAANKDV